MGKCIDTRIYANSKYVTEGGTPPGQNRVSKVVFTPGVTALQLRLQPVEVWAKSVWKKIFTRLLLVVMIGGRK